MPGKPPPEDPRRCTAGSKRRPGERCEAWAMTGKDVCYHHGGKSPIAAGSPHFRDGRRSKYRAVFAGGVLEHYESARDDPRYLELREEMAMLDTLLVEELGRARIGQGGALWEELEKVWGRFRSVDPTTNASTAGWCLRRVGEIIDEGVARQVAQREALDIVERKRRLSETERRRIVEAQRTLSEAQALAFAGAMAAIVRQHADRETLARIHADFARLVQQHVYEDGGAFPGF